MRTENIIPGRMSAANPQVIYPSVLTEKYLLKGITNISHIHMQTAVQEGKQHGQSSTACFFPFLYLLMCCGWVSPLHSWYSVLQELVAVPKDVISITNRECTVESHPKKSELIIS